MFKNLHHLKNKLVNNRNTIINTTKRFYRETPIKPPGGGGYASWALIGAGTAGIAYLMMYGSQLKYRAPYQPGAYPTQQMTYLNPVV